jgi:hypothetical protein
MGGVNQVAPRRGNVRGRGTEGSTFGALGTIPARARAILANDFASVLRPEEH